MMSIPAISWSRIAAWVARNWASAISILERVPFSTSFSRASYQRGTL
jgi:hypothetical protein